MAVVSKLLAIVLLLATSFAMTAAPAAATGSHDAPAAAMPMQHCPGEDGKADMKGGVPECAMACSSALPATDLLRPELQTMVSTPDATRIAKSLHGLHPETATPPPKRS